LITIGLNVWLIPIWGYEGAAYSTLLCYFSMAAASYFIGQKYMPTPYPAMRLLVYVGIFYWASSTFETITERWDVAWVWALRIAYMVIYALLLLYEGTPLYKARKHRVS
jgi:O-antigen/teichoic acid export membrane protein